MFSLALRLRIRPATAIGWRRRVRLLRLAVVAFAVPRGPVVARAARKLSTVRLSARSPMTTLPEPSPASCAGELDLLDRLVGRLGHEPQQREDRVARVDVGAHRLAEDAQQLLAVGEDAADADLVLGLAQERLLARSADEVVVEVAVAHVAQRVLAAQPLVAGADVDGRVGPAAAVGRAVVVEVLVVDVDVDAAEAVDGPAEAPEGDPHVVVDGDLQQVADGAQRQAVLAVGEGGVELLAPVAGDVDDQVARQRHQRRGALVGVQAHEDHGVRARGRRVLLQRLGLAAVVADDEDRLRLAGRDVGQELLDLWIDRRRVALEDRDPLVDLEEHGRGDGRRAQGT